MQRKLIFLACFFICVNCFSQQYPFVYYTPKDGLINGRVKTIKQDSKGRMYFITFGGLSVYDGTKFTNYNRQDGLANDVINDIVEIEPDTLLVSSNTQKLNTLIHGKIGIYQTSDNFYPITNRFLKSSNGQWYVTADEGLFVLSNKKFTRIPLLYNGTDIGRNVDYIVEWENYFLISPWASALNIGIILYDRLQQKVVDTLSKENGLGAMIDSKKEVWVNTPKGLRILDSKLLRQGKCVLKSVPKEFSSLIIQEGTSAYFDATGNAWFFSKNQVQKISPDLKTEKISFTDGIKGGINYIFSDREGIVWMALDGGGIIKLKSTNVQLLTALVPGQSMSFSCMDQKGDTLWCYDRIHSCIYRVTETGIKKFLLKPGTTAFNLHVYGGKIFLGNTRKLMVIKNKSDAASYLSPQIEWTIKEDRVGNSLIDPFGAVLQLFQRNDSSYSISAIKNNRVLFEHPISYLADQMTIDHKGRLWLATRNNHILVFKINPSDPSHYLQLLNDFHKDLPQMDPRSIAIDEKDQVWIGTRYNGLFQFRQNGPALQLLHHYTTKEGLTDNFVYTLARGRDNAIWIGTQTGLDKIFLKNGHYVIANPGKNNNIFQTVFRIEITDNGTVWAMNNDGSLIKILPETHTTLPHTPSLVFTSIRINDSLPELPSNKFSYRQNNFSFSVAAPSFIDEGSILYSYWLEGSGHSHWSEPSNISTFNFINLSPGQYTFHAKAVFPEEKYAPQTLSYSFTILPAWWQTWWFRSGFGLFMIAIGILIIRLYYKRKLEKQKIFLEKQQAVEKERTRIATDMHDDLGAGLSRIKFLSETIGIKKQQEQPIEEEITKIREYSHQMIDKMGEIVWALNERNDSLSDLLAYTRAYAMEYLSQNGIQCKVEMPSYSESYFLSGEFRRNIFLSVKEILHNIVKHAQASQVSITIDTEKELQIKITDNGIGFSSSFIKPFSNGLYNIEKRMKDIKGKSEIKSHEGTSIFLMAPLPR